jgi:hypothetical protein
LTRLEARENFIKERKRVTRDNSSNNNNNIIIIIIIIISVTHLQLHAVRKCPVRGI